MSRVTESPKPAVAEFVAESNKVAEFVAETNVAESNKVAESTNVVEN
ncbi:hypothetical protein [Kitasatospora sp. NBC_01266]|nr:hypothetical protein [Kitasatospora sp. NBC_01266]